MNVDEEDEDENRLTEGSWGRGEEESPRTTAALWTAPDDLPSFFSVTLDLVIELHIERPTSAVRNEHKEEY